MLAENTQFAVECDGRVLTVAQQGSPESRYHAVWLRDSVNGSPVRSQPNSQRLMRVSDVPQNVTIQSVTVNGVDLAIVFGPDGFEATYNIHELLKEKYDYPRSQGPGWILPSVQLFDRDTDPDIHIGDYQEVMADDRALTQWLLTFEKYGFARLIDCPTREEVVTEVVARFGYVRETNYGRFNNVRPSTAPANLADSSLGLQPHTDNPYRDPVPTLQLLHCISNQATGGATEIVDGYAVAKALQSEDAEGFRLLSTYPARFAYYGSGDQHLTSKACLIDLHTDGQLRGIRFNNRSVAPLRDVPFELMENYYAAYRRFSDLIDSGRFSVRFTLEPGHLVLMCNTRVLHGRSAITNQGHTRWLQGCYADIDGLHSTLGVLRQQFTEFESVS